MALKEGDLNSNSKAKGTGYEFLNNLFFERHRRLIVKPIFKRAAVIAVIMLAGFLFMKFKHEALSWNVNKYITIILAELVFIMFNNESVSRAMFLNCDRPLMRYGFYKNKAAVFDMYKLRYMSFLKLNIPGLLAALVVFGIGYSLFKEITMAEMLVYVLFIIACYIFYPAFNLGNYYICQPYNSDAKNVGIAYKWVSAILSYVNILFIPLFIIKEVADGIYILKIYAIIMVLLTILYFAIVKGEGDKTFRIKQ